MLRQRIRKRYYKTFVIHSPMSPPSLVKLLIYRKTWKHSVIVGTPLGVHFTGLGGTDRHTNILLLSCWDKKILWNWRDTYDNTLYRFGLDILLQNYRYRQTDINPITFIWNFSGILGTPLGVHCSGLGWIACSRTKGTDSQTEILLILYEIIAEL